jgi:hypothetical protein
VLPPQQKLTGTTNPGPDAGSPVAQAKTAPAPRPAAPSPWKLRVEIIDGRTQLTARTENGMELQVRCEKLSLVRPQGNIEAAGKVELTGKELEGRCDRLTIDWEEERVSLEGDAQVTSHRNGQELELRGPRLDMRLNNSQK